jgi:hypothetical protein
MLPWYIEKLINEIDTGSLDPANSSSAVFTCAYFQKIDQMFWFFREVTYICSQNQDIPEFL